MNYSRADSLIFRMRIYEQVDNNAQDLEAANRQLRHQLSAEQQVLSFSRGSMCFVNGSLD